MARGKLIVLYGTNNLGKSTQAKLLVKKLNQTGVSAEYLKYPIYNSDPTGPKLNDILRGGKKQSIGEVELQSLYAQNRQNFQPELEKKLAIGVTVVAEDYTGTGLAWGVTKGAPLETLEQQNQGLLTENLAILLDGERFLSGKEANHLHESSDELMQRCRRVHLDLAKKFGWKIVEANQPIDTVAEKIWEIIKKINPQRN